MSPSTCMTEIMSRLDLEPVAVWTDYKNNVLMSDFGVVDTTCFARVLGGHCPKRYQCVVLGRPPGPRLLFGSELMSDIDDEAGIYLETHAKDLGHELISITVDHVVRGGNALTWRYRLLPIRWKTEDGWVETSTRLAVWPD
jgi:hypothetical protein